jgi:hypothetical protein
VLFRSKAYPNANITLLKDGKVIVLTKADYLADFKIEVNNLTPGVWTFSIWAQDSAGRKSLAFSFTTNIVSGMTTTISDIFIAPTIELDKVNMAKGETLKIVGETAPKSDVDVFIGSEPELIKTTKADNAGSWYYSFDTTPLEEGTHTSRAKSKLEGSLLSSFSQVLSFYVGKYTSQESCPKADFNKDGKTNIVDFSIMLYWWWKANTCVDQNQDGVVNLPDFSILMYWWTG